MIIHYLRELDEESYATLPDRRILIEKTAFESIGDYTGSMPTSPSPGRVYRKNLAWPEEPHARWYVYICEADPSDQRYALHHPYRAEIVGEAGP